VNLRKKTETKETERGMTLGKKRREEDREEEKRRARTLTRKESIRVLTPLPLKPHRMHT